MQNSSHFLGIFFSCQSVRIIIAFVFTHSSTECVTQSFIIAPVLCLQ